MEPIERVRMLKNETNRAHNPLPRLTRNHVYAHPFAKTRGSLVVLLLVAVLALASCATSGTTLPTARQTGTTGAASPTSGACGDAYLCNPWGYNFNCCHNVLLDAVGSPTVAQFCAFFTCNATLYQYRGVVVLCPDNTFTRTFAVNSDQTPCGGGSGRHGGGGGARGLLSRS